MRNRGFLGPYRLFRSNRPLQLLIAGEGLSSAADWLLAVVLSVLVFRISRTEATIALLSIARLGPYALVLPWAGVVLDRLDRRLVMAGLGFGRAILVLGLLLVQSKATLPLAYLLVFAASSMSCLLRPTVNATLPSLVAEDEGVSGNSLVGQVDGVAHVIGPALAGMFFFLHAPRAALLAASLAFALSGAALLGARHPIRSSAAKTLPDLSVGEVLAGFRFLLRENERVLVGLSTTACGLALLAGAYYVLAVALCTKTFHFGSQGVGWLDAMYGVGGVVGSVLVASIVRGRRVSRLFIGGAALNSIGVLLLALSPAGPAPFVCIMVVGAADVVVQVTATTILQAATPRQMLGRVFTAFEATLVLGTLVGAGVAAGLVRATDPRIATVVFALVGAVLLLGSLPLLGSMDDVLGLRVFLRAVPLLSDLPRPLLDEIAPAFEATALPAGASVVREGDPGDRLYIIRSGEVEVSVGDRIVRKLGPAGYFGEVALLRSVARTASVRTSAATALYSLHRDAFQKLIHHSDELAPRLVEEADRHYVYASSPILHH